MATASEFESESLYRTGTDTVAASGNFRVTPSLLVVEGWQLELEVRVQVQLAQAVQ